uniref:Uncharacterized protein n=1 Tax=Rhipicephalus microplus TaxID=6941 RepID=A0A6G5AH55_RHIMP
MSLVPKFLLYGLYCNVLTLHTVTYNMLCSLLHCVRLASKTAPTLILVALENCHVSGSTNLSNRRVSQCMQFITVANCVHILYMHVSVSFWLIYCVYKLQLLIFLFV